MLSVEPKDLPTPEALIDDPIRRADYYHNVIVTVLGIRRNDFPGGIDGFLVLAAGAARVLRGQVINVTKLSAATGFSRRKVRRLLTVLRDAQDHHLRRRTVQLPPDRTRDRTVENGADLDTDSLKPTWARALLYPGAGPLRGAALMNPCDLAGQQPMWANCPFSMSWTVV